MEHDTDTKHHRLSICMLMKTAGGNWNGPFTVYPGKPFEYNFHMTTEQLVVEINHLRFQPWTL